MWAALRAACEAAGGPVLQREVVERTGLGRHAVRIRLAELVAQGRARRHGEAERWHTFEALGEPGDVEPARYGPRPARSAASTLAALNRESLRTARPGAQALSRAQRAQARGHARTVIITRLSALVTRLFTTHQREGPPCSP